MKAKLTILLMSVLFFGGSLVVFANTIKDQSFDNPSGASGRHKTDYYYGKDREPSSSPNDDQQQMPNDNDLVSSVKEIIATDPSTASSPITVSSKNGIIFLSGDVKTDNEASSAIQAVQSVRGVRDVDASGLKVQKSVAPFNDIVLTAKVKGAFLREKLFGDRPVSVWLVKVESKNGVVHLFGSVTDVKLANNAITIARSVEGVKEVRSKIKLVSENKYSRLSENKHSNKRKVHASQKA